MLSLAGVLASSGGMAAATSNAWIPHPRKRDAQSAEVGSYRQDPQSPALRQAAFWLGTFSWHLCGQALKIASMALQPAQLPTEDSRPLWAVVVCFFLTAVGNESTRLSWQSLNQNLGWAREARGGPRLQPPI